MNDVHGHVLLTPIRIRIICIKSRRKKHPNKQQFANIIVAICKGCRSNFVKLKIVNFCPPFQACSPELVALQVYSHKRFIKSGSSENF
jgi:hypothetical protein